jgi:hypothetical protein
MAESFRYDVGIGKMPVHRNVGKIPDNKKRRLQKETAFLLDRSSTEETLSLAGLAATYSPRA